MVMRGTSVPPSWLRVMSMSMPPVSSPKSRMLAGAVDVGVDGRRPRPRGTITSIRPTSAVTRIVAPVQRLEVGDVRQVER